MFERIFKLREHNTSVRQELVAGVTTFLTMAYILFVNPNILSDAGMDKNALITATALAAAAGTLLLGLWVNVPFAMAPGMGLNAYFTYTLVIGQGLHWQTALGVVFLSGVLFLVLAAFGFREKIIDAIPDTLRIAIPAGIGLFITFIGFQNMGLITQSEATLITLGALNTPVLLGLFGLALIIVLEAQKVKGSILIGIIATTVLGIFFGDVSLPDSLVSSPPAPGPVAFELDIIAALKWSLAGAIFAFMFVDMFDSVGTLIACSYEAGMVDKEGKIDRIGEMLGVDAIATMAGALFGTSTTTTYIESGSGIEVGGRTGLTAAVVALLFLLALLFTPVIGIVPSYATAPALVIVGLFMFKSIRTVDLREFEQLVPVFLTVVLMPLTYSISLGLTFGFLSYILLMVIRGKAANISWIMWVIGLFSLMNLWITG